MIITGHGLYPDHMSTHGIEIGKLKDESGNDLGHDRGRAALEETAASLVFAPGNGVVLSERWRALWPEADQQVITMSFGH